MNSKLGLVFVLVLAITLPCHAQVIDTTANLGVANVFTQTNQFILGVEFGPVLFSQLPSEIDGIQIYCADCHQTNPCSAGGTGAMAAGIDGVWSCTNGGTATPVYTLQVAGTPLTAGDTVNFNASLPSAPTNGYNVTFAASKSGSTDSVSAAIIGDGNSAHCFIGTGAFATCPATGVTSISAGTGITLTPNPIVGTGSVAITNTAVTPGSYTSANITVNQQGQITSAANGGYTLQVAGVSLTANDTINFNNTLPTAPSNGLNVVFATSRSGTTDSVSAAVVGDGNSAHYLNGTGTYTTPPGSYVPCGGLGLGDGVNAIAAATYPQYGCTNRSGVTRTITGVFCYTDNAGTSTLTVTNNAGSTISGPITCNNTKSGGGASGSLSITTMVNNDALNFSFVSDGATKTTTWLVTLTQ